MFYTLLCRGKRGGKREEEGGGAYLCQQLRVLHVRRLWQLDDPARKARGVDKVFLLEGHGHGEVERQQRVHGLQLRVRGVSGKLHGAHAVRGVARLRGCDAAQRELVLRGGREHRLHRLRLLPLRHHRQRDGGKERVGGARGVGELALGEGAVHTREAGAQLLQTRRRDGQRQVPRRRRVEGPAV